MALDLTVTCFPQALLCCEWYRDTQLTPSAIGTCQVTPTPVHNFGNPFTTVYTAVGNTLPMAAWLIKNISMKWP